jgi:hypothetical protein
MNSNANIGRANQRKGEQETGIRKKPGSRKRMPCGAPTCLHCHAQCGAVMSSYILKDLETPEDS